MLHANFIKIGLISCALGLAACGEMDTSDDPATQTAADELPTVALVGTFGSDSRRVGDFTQLVLKTNATFHSATLMECFAPPCDPVQEDGMYKMFWRDSGRYMAFYNVEGVFIGQYQYEWQDNSLRLLKVTRDLGAVPNMPWQSMWLSNAAWCANLTVTAPTASTPSDCQLQNLPVGPCAGQWNCVSNVCNWSCGTTR